MEDEVTRRFLELEDQLRQVQGIRPPGGLSYDERRGIGGLVPADLNHDGDMDPLTSTSWDGDSFSTGTGTINWHKVFGVPHGVKAVAIRTTIRDSSATVNAGVLNLQARSGTTVASYITATTVGSDALNYMSGVVPVAADGTSYYSITASGASTCDIWIRVVGWYA